MDVRTNGKYDASKVFSTRKLGVCVLLSGLETNE